MTPADFSVFKKSPRHSLGFDLESPIQFVDYFFKAKVGKDPG